MPISPTPSQWPRNTEGHFAKLCPTQSDERTDWKNWVSLEERSRTAYAFHWINLFRYVLTYNVDNSQPGPKLSDKMLPQPSALWLASTNNQWSRLNKNETSILRIPRNLLISCALSKEELHAGTATENALCLQLAVLQQTFKERCSTFIANLSGGQITENTFREEGKLLVGQLDWVFSLKEARIPIASWKSDIFGLFLLHHTLVLVRSHTIPDLCDLAVESGSLTYQIGDTELQDQSAELRATSLWRAAHIWHACLSASKDQLQQLIVPYAIFVSVMFLVSLRLYRRYVLAGSGILIEIDILLVRDSRSTENIRTSWRRAFHRSAQALELYR